MKNNPHFSLSTSDIETLTFALSIFPPLSDQFAQTDSQAEINNALTHLVLSKIKNGITTFSPNETRIMFSSLLGAQLIANNGIDVDDTIKKECRSRFFTINKLCSMFAQFFPDEP